MKEKVIKAIGWVLFCSLIGFALNIGGRAGRALWPDREITVNHVSIED